MSGCGGQCGCGGAGSCSKGGHGGCSGNCAKCPNRQRKAEAALAALVRQVVEEVVREVEAAEAASLAPAVTSNAAPPVTPVVVTGGAPAVTGGAAAAAEDEAPIWSRGPKHRRLPDYRLPESAERLKRSTPARLLQGRTGTRYLTESYLGLRADHAIAIDAVESQVPEAFVGQQGWLPLRTKAKDKQEFLLHPEQGRSLDDASRQLCAQQASQGVDVQLIAGDGLSAVALMANGPATMKALDAQLKAAGFTVGKPLFVRFARIGVQDDIGVLTKAKCTVILVGERPGLGTGDSLSLYTAFGPKLGQDNSEKDCISNVRGLGFPPEQAAATCVRLLKRTFAAGGGGVKLGETR